MQTKDCLPLSRYRDREQNQELIGVLTAISVVSKRLAGRLAALDHRMARKPEGGKRYVTRQGATNRQ